MCSVLNALNVTDRQTPKDIWTTERPKHYWNSKVAEIQLTLRNVDYLIYLFYFNNSTFPCYRCYFRQRFD